MLTVPTEFSDIPIEVLDKILDFLHDDRKALRSASLVSSGWVSTPRHHLFERTTIIEDFIADKLAAKANARTFLALAESEHCTILPAIRYISLFLFTPALIEDIVKVIARLRAPARMMYTHFTHSKSISWNASNLLNVHDFTFNSWSTFGVDACRLVASFSNLHKLSIYGNSPTASVTLPSGISKSSFRNLRVLQLSLLASEELFNWLIQENLEGSHFALETLDLRMLRRSQYHSGWGSVDALNSFLREVSDTLKHLSLEMHYLFDLSESHLPNEKSSRIDLSRLTNLRSLSFRTHDINAVCSSLASLNPSLATLEVLNVHILRWHTMQMKRCDCVYSTLLTRFATIMEAKQLIGTKALGIKIPHEIEVDIVVDLLLRWNRSGALELTNHAE